MPFTTINGRNVPIRIWAPMQEVDSQVITQLKNVAGLPWVAHHVAVMPDVHVGKGATVGSVIAMRGAVAPAAVGVDIGCGMAAVKTSLVAKHLPDDLRGLRVAIEKAIPVGKHFHDEPVWHQAGNELIGIRPMGWSAARTAASSTKRPKRTRTSRASWRSSRTWSRSWRSSSRSFA